MGIKRIEEKIVSNQTKIPEWLLHEVSLEYGRALSKFGDFNSMHEGYAVLLEELDELWDEVKLKEGLRNPTNTRKECVQIAAMALKFAHAFGDGD